MLILQGLLRAATTIGGGTNRKTGEVIPERKVLQVETLDSRGLVEVKTITVPDLKVYESKVGQKVNVPVRAWAANTTVNFMYENTVQGA
mgnify:CR=1 FL=1